MGLRGYFCSQVSSHNSLANLGHRTAAVSHLFGGAQPILQSQPLDP